MEATALEYNIEEIAAAVRKLSKEEERSRKLLTWLPTVIGLITIFGSVFSFCLWVIEIHLKPIHVELTSTKVRISSIDHKIDRIEDKIDSIKTGGLQ